MKRSTHRLLARNVHYLKMRAEARLFTIPASTFHLFHLLHSSFCHYMNYSAAMTVILNLEPISAVVISLFMFTHSCHDFFSGNLLFFAPVTNQLVQSKAPIGHV